MIRRSDTITRRMGESGLAEGLAREIEGNVAGQVIRTLKGMGTESATAGQPDGGIDSDHRGWRAHVRGKQVKGKAVGGDTPHSLEEVPGPPRPMGHAHIEGAGSDHIVPTAPAPHAASSMSMASPSRKVAVGWRRRASARWGTERSQPV